VDIDVHQILFLHYNTVMPENRDTYLWKLFHFYFRPEWVSIFRGIFLLIFVYFVLFYIGNLLVALKFLLFTVQNSSGLLGLSSLFWGVSFIISLVTPFFISVYSILLLYEINKSHWARNKKFLVNTLVVIGTPIIVVFMDGVLRTVLEQEVFIEFVSSIGIKLLGA